MTQILKSGGLPLVALVGLLGCCELASAQSLRTTFSRDDLVKAIQSNKDADTKLKRSYQELVVAYKQGAAVARELAAVNNALLNRNIYDNVRSELKSRAPKLEADLNRRKAAVTRHEATYKADQEALLKSLNESCVPVLRGLIRGLDGSSLEAVDSLFDLFVLAEQKELPWLQIGASFVDQDVWKEASKCMARHGVGHLAELKKILFSKNTPAKYAAASAVGELGEQVFRLDTRIYQELLSMDATRKKSTIDDSEKLARRKILAAAMESLRTKQKK